MENMEIISPASLKFGCLPRERVTTDDGKGCPHGSVGRLYVRKYIVWGKVSYR